MNELIKTNTMKEVVITNPTIIFKDNLSKESPKLMTNPLKVGDINFTVAISLPKVMTNNENMILFLNMANRLATFMEQENIETTGQWINLIKDEEWKLKMYKRFIDESYKVCTKNKFDMVEFASILFDYAEDLFKFDRQWCDSLVTSQTNLKYEWLPILCGVAATLEQIFKEYTQRNK